MTCDELESLQGPYLDNELETGMTLAVEQHLAGCTSCARAFAEQGKLQARITTGLKHGQRTAALWKLLEASVLAEASSAARLPASVPQRSLPSWLAPIVSPAISLGARLRPARVAWAGLAAGSLLILLLNFSAPESDARLATGPHPLSGRELRSVLAQKQLLMTELTPSPGVTSSDRPRAAVPGPRSERRNKTLNT
jgi:anti-sigma factor RsiW